MGVDVSTETQGNSIFTKFKTNMSQGFRAQPSHFSRPRATENSIGPAGMHPRDFLGDLLEDGPHQTTRHQENVTRTSNTVTPVHYTVGQIIKKKKRQGRTVCKCCIFSERREQWIFKRGRREKVQSRISSLSTMGGKEYHI